MKLMKLLLGMMIAALLSGAPAAAQTTTTDHQDTNSKTKKALKKLGGKTKDAAENTGDAVKDGSTTAAKKTKDATAGSSADHANMVDINTASKEELSALPGIGDAYSQKIIDGRPYRAKTELVRKNVLPQNTYDQIKGHIVARQSGAHKKASAAKAL